MYRPQWWETGCRDEIWLGRDILIWAAQDLRAGHPALTTAARPFVELLCAARAEYPLPPRHVSGNRFSVNAARWLPYLRSTDSGWVIETAGWIAATDGSVRPAQLAPDNGPYEPAGLGAGILLARPGALLNDPALFQPDMPLEDDGSTAISPRHNDGSVRPPYAPTTRGHSDRAVATLSVFLGNPCQCARSLAAFSMPSSKFPRMPTGRQAVPVRGRQRC